MSNFKLDKENINEYIKEVAKIYCKNKMNPPIEIIIVGGAAIMMRHNFRMMTNDIDALCPMNGAIQDAFKQVRDKYNLPDDWFNTDFTKTKSYSKNLRLYSKYYREFNHGKLSVRLIENEYLLAMKMRSGRIYKKDMSDVVGIVYECRQKTPNFSYQMVEKAYHDLYNEELKATASIQMDRILTEAFMQPIDKLAALYNQVSNIENKNKSTLLNIEKYTPNILNENNVENYIDTDFDIEI